MDKKTFMMMMSGGGPSSLLNGIVSAWHIDEASDGTGAVTRADSVGGHDAIDVTNVPSAGGKIANGAEFTIATTEYLRVADHADLRHGDRDFTWSFWVKFKALSGVQVCVAKWGAGANKRECFCYANGTALAFAVSSNGSSGAPVTTVTASTFGALSINTWYHILAWHDAANNLIGVSVNGTATTAAHATGVFTGDAYVGFGDYVEADGSAGAGSFLSGYLDEIARWNRLLTAPEIVELYAGGSGNAYPFDSSGRTLGQLVFDGNSMTAGASSTYPRVAFNTLARPYRYYNFGVSGQTTQDMTADAVAQIDALYDAALQKNIVVCWEGSQDLRVNQPTITAADAIANLVAYCEARRSAGWRVVILTLLPRIEDAGHSYVGYAADRAVVNASIVANWASYADALADVAADGRIGDDGDETDVTYYSDGVHMTAAGYAIVAGIVATAIGTI